MCINESNWLHPQGHGHTHTQIKLLHCEVHRLNYCENLWPTSRYVYELEIAYSLCPFLLVVHSIFTVYICQPVFLEWLFCGQFVPFDLLPQNTNPMIQNVFDCSDQTHLEVSNNLFNSLIRKKSVSLFFFLAAQKSCYNFNYLLYNR